MPLERPSPHDPVPLPPLDTADIPLSTYRVQFHAGFTFKDATAAVPYLKSLGISHLYASPYLKARKGSTHGYDVVDHNALNPEVGTEADFDAMCATLAQHGMKQLLDIVPNHMGVLEADNAWWLDVMEHGQRSAYADSFDIDWNSPVAGLKGKVLVGLLGDQYGAVLENGDFRLGFNGATGGFSVTYFEHCFPIDPACTSTILAAAPLPSDASATEREPLRKLLDGFAKLALPESPPSPVLTRLEPPSSRPRSETALALRAALAEWMRATPWARAWLDACLVAMNGEKGSPRSFDKLDALLRAQAWRLAHWRTTGAEVNYRRFFDVNTLAAIRNEKLEVFEESHRTILGWVNEGRLAGLRIDHPDGLSDPHTYLLRLQQRNAAMRHASGKKAEALYVVVEKILADDEVMPGDWLTQGDTGYHFSNQVNGVFVDSEARSAFDELYESFVQHRIDYDETLHTAKHTVMKTSLAADLELLTDALYGIARGDRTTCDFTRTALQNALAELASNFSVYRTYIGFGTHGGAEPLAAQEPGAVDRGYLQQAAEASRRYALGSALTGIEYLCRVLLEAHLQPDLERRRTMLRFATRWQQFTAPVMAKSMEDTTFYRYLRLISLNDVGGDPREFGMSVDAFHAANSQRAEISPHTLLGTSTHDSKRSEDVRARLDVLSEMPELWNAALQRWHAMNDVHATSVATMHSARTPTLNHEYLFYQTLVGAWPMTPMNAEQREDFRQRVQAFMLKATREGKDATSWLEPDEPYEKGLAKFIDGCLGHVSAGDEGAADVDRASADGNRFAGDIESFVAGLAPFGAANSLGVVALKLTSPGVPDVYQSCESWNLSLVDPDNRRHVDFDDLAAKLRDIRSSFGESDLPSAAAMTDIATHWTDGRIKMLVTWRLMKLRASNAPLFRDGAYSALAPAGRAAEHIIAFMRHDPKDASARPGAITITGRLLHRLTHGEAARLASAPDSLWADTRVMLPADLPEMSWQDAITGKSVRSLRREGDQATSLAVADVLAWTTVAVLSSA